MEQAATDMGEKLRVQITRMVAGNGLPPESVSLANQHSQTIKLHGQLDIRLITRGENLQGRGMAPTPWHQKFESPADISASITPLQKQLNGDKERLRLAADQLLAQDHQGWGLVANDIPIPQLNFIAGCQYNCPNCDGTKNQTCGTCNGTMRQVCSACNGKRETTCPTCFGRGVLSSGENCAACRTRGVVECAQCQGHGETACAHCGGKGQTPCKGCDAQGTLYQQITLHSFAQTNFKMLLAEDLPEELMRHIRKLKPENLLDGRATISQQEIEAHDDFIRVKYIAEFPISSYQFQIGNMTTEFVTLGHKDTLFEAPNFMDRLLSPALDQLRRARKREIPASTTLQELGKFKFFRHALGGGKNMPLRRRYPFGISSNLLREVPAGMHYLLSIMTEQPRMLAAIAINALSAIILLYVYALGSEKPFGIGDIILWLFLLGASAAAVLAAHYFTSAKTLKSFGIRPNVQITHLITILGRTGIASLGVTLLLCILFRLFG